MSARLFFALILCLLAPAGASAAEGDKLFNPTSGWLVGPATVAEQETTGTTPCLMLNQYENGFTFRFSGGDGKIFAVAVDFRQPAFRPTQHYPLSIAIDGHFDRRFDAVAYDSSVLIVGASDAAIAESFYKALAGGQELSLTLGRQRIDFALLGTTNGLQRLEACFGVSPAPAKEQLSGNGPAIPTIIVHPASPPPPLGGVDASLAKAADTVSRPLPDENVPLPDPSAPSPPVDQPQSAAPPAEPVSAPPPPEDPPSAAVVSTLPPNAVSTPEAESAPPPKGQPADSPGDEPASETSVTWTAKSHASLRETLSAWSDKRGAQLVWDMHGDFPVPESMSVDGKYEQAVQGLLTEYQNANPRPAGSLVVDPETHRMQLTIKSVGP